VEDPSKCSGTPTRREACQYGLNLLRCHPMADLSLVAGPRKELLWKDSREIDNSPGDRRQRDATAARRILGVNATDTMCHNPCNPPLHECDHLWSWWVAPDQPPQEGGGTGNQESPSTAGQHSRDVAGLDTWGSVPDAVDPRVLPKQ
jgi:hypothetical protein